MFVVRGSSNNLEYLNNASVNYPKYVVLLRIFDHSNKDNVYYLISKSSSFYDATIFPEYLITLEFFFIATNVPEKFNLSKLGTDYIFNEICTYGKNECTSVYPDNYVFVEEPPWPQKFYGADRSPLKNFKKESLVSREN